MFSFAAALRPSFIYKMTQVSNLRTIYPTYGVEAINTAQENHETAGNFTCFAIYVSFLKLPRNTLRATGQYYLWISLEIELQMSRRWLRCIQFISGRHLEQNMPETNNIHRTRRRPGSPPNHRMNPRCKTQ